MATVPFRFKVIGDPIMGEYMREVRTSDLLGSPFDFVSASTMTALALELDSNGPEKVAVLICMNSILDGYVLDSLDTRESPSFDRLRIILESYTSRHHDVYICMPLGRSTSRATELSKDISLKLHVSSE